MPNDGLRGDDKQQADLRAKGRDTPEGLKRPRRGPYDKKLGRAKPEQEETSNGRE